MEVWKEYKLGELCSSVCSGGTPSSKHSEYYAGNIPWLNTKEINFNRIYSTEKCITEEGLNNSSAKWIKENTVIVAMYGATAGKTAITKIPLTTNQACCNLTIDNQIADYRFVYYHLCNKFNELASLANGGAQQNLNSQIIKEFPIYLPSLSEQKNIANVLSSLDDKIENNRRINENLEQQAQALFKSWFVDFEPFKNGEFVESELGMIPKGWRVVELQDVVTIKRGGSPRPIQVFLSLSGYHWLKISDATACQSPYIFEIKEFIKESGLSKTVKLDAGSLVLSNSATPGIPKILGVDSCIHDGWLYFPQSHLSKFYLYMLFKEKRDFLLSQGNGSVFTNLKTDIVKAMKIAIANDQIMVKFNTVIESLFNQIENKTKESRRLATLRDTLLPKLMSGEIKVNEIEI